MPLGTRDVLVLIRARDLASRDINKVGRSFSQLGRQVAASNEAVRASQNKMNDAMADFGKRERLVRRVYQSQIDGLGAQRQALRSNAIAIAQNTLLNTKAEEQLAKASKAQKKNIQEAMRARSTASAQMRADNALIRASLADQTAAFKKSRDDQIAGIDRMRQIRRDEHNEVLRLNREHVESLRQREAETARMQQRGAARMTAGTVGLVAGAVGIAGLAAATAEAARFRQEAALTLTQVDGLSASVQDLEAVAQRVASAISVPIEQLQQGLFDVFSSIDVSSIAEAEQYVERFAQAAVAGATDLRTASRASIALFNSFYDGGMGQNAEQRIQAIDRIMDIQFQTVRKGVIEYDELANSIGRAIPAAEQSGQSLETLGGAMAFITRRGLSAEMAATSVGRAFELLGNSKVADRMNDIGISVTNADGSYRQFNDVIRDLAQNMEGLTAPEKAQRLQELFKGSGNLIQARRFIIQAIQNFEEFDRRVDDMQNSAGAMSEAYRIMFQQPLSQMQLLKNNFTILGQEIGEVLLPVINSLLRTGQDLVTWFRNLDSATRNAVVWGAGIASLTVAVGGLLLMLSGAGLIIRAAATTLFGLAEGATVTSAAFGALKAAMGFLVANPVVLAIGGLVAGLTALAIAAQESKESFDTTGDAAQTLARSLNLAFEDIQAGATDSSEAISRFRQENIEAIETAKRLSTEGQTAYVLSLGLELVRRGNDVASAQAAIDMFKDELDLDVEINLTGDLSESTVDAARGLMQEVADTIGDFDESMTPDRFMDMIDNLEPQLRGVADVISTAFNAGDMDGFTSAWTEAERVIRDSGFSAEVTERLLRDLSVAVAEGTGVQGLSTRGYEDMATAIADMVGPTSQLDTELKQVLERFGETGNIDYFLTEVNRLNQIDAGVRLAEDMTSAGVAFGTVGQIATTSSEDIINAVESLDDVVIPDWAGDIADVFTEMIDASQAFEDAFGSVEEEIEARYGEIADGIREEFALAKDAIRTNFDGAEEARLLREQTQLMQDALDINTDQMEAELESASVNIDDFIGNLQQQYEDMRAFGDNLVLIATEVGPQFAAALANQDPRLVAQFADEARNGILDSFEDLEPLLTTLVSGGMENVGLEMLESVLGPLGELPDDLSTLAGDAAGGFSQGMIDRLNEEYPAYAGALARYADGSIAVLNPLLRALDKQPIKLPGMVSGGVTPGFNTGGLIPGGGPDKDSVFSYLTPGEYVMRRKAVQMYGPAAMEAINDGSATIHYQAYNDGGMVSASDLPTPAPVAGFGSYLQDANLGSQERMFREASKFIEDNAAPQLGTGIGYQAMMAALRVRFPGLPLYSGFRPGAITATGNASYHGKGRAVDIPPRLDVNKWIYDNYKAQTKELILSIGGARQIRNGRDHYYTGITRANHFDHNHWAMANGGIVNSPISTFLGESGPEAVMPLDQFAQAVSAIKNVADEIKSMGKGNKKALEDLGKQIDGLSSMLDDMQSFMTAQQNVVDAQKAVAEAVQDLVDIEAKILDLREQSAANAAAKDSLKEDIAVMEARDALVTAAETLDTLNARERASEAQRNLAELRRGPSEEQQLTALNAEKAYDDLYTQLREVATFTNGGWVPKNLVDEAEVKAAQQGVDQARDNLQQAELNVGAAQADLNSAKALLAEARAVVSQKQADFALAQFEVARVQQIAEIVAPYDEVQALLMQYKALKEKADIETELAEAKLAEADAGQAVVGAEQALFDAQKERAAAAREMVEAQDALNVALEGTKISLHDLAVLELEVQIAREARNAANAALIITETDIAKAQAEAQVAQEALLEAMAAETAETSATVAAKEQLAQLEQEGIDLTALIVETLAAREEAVAAIAAAEWDLLMANLGLIEATHNLMTASIEWVDLSPAVASTFGGIAAEANAASAAVAGVIGQLQALATAQSQAAGFSASNAPATSRASWQPQGSSGASWQPSRSVNIAPGAVQVTAPGADRQVVERAVNTAFRRLSDEITRR